MNDQEIESGVIREIEPEVRTLFTKLVEHDPQEAAKMLEPYPDEFVVQMLELLNPASALKILQRFNPSRRQTILATASPETNKQWMRNQTYPERSIGRLMQPHWQSSVRKRQSPKQPNKFGGSPEKQSSPTALYNDRRQSLRRCDARHAPGAQQSASRGNLLKNPFYLTPGMSLPDAMRAVLVRHFPVYPVCDKMGRLLGLLRGQMLFEAEAIELSAQPGAMVGVESEERLTTPWLGA